MGASGSQVAAETLPGSGLPQRRSPLEIQGLSLEGETGLDTGGRVAQRAALSGDPNLGKRIPTPDDTQRFQGFAKQ
jgi:hypothetical protein